MFFTSQSCWQNSGDYVRYLLQKTSKAILITGRWRSFLPLWVAPLLISLSPRLGVSCICLSVHQLVLSGGSGSAKADPSLTVTPGGRDASFLNAMSQTIQLGIDPDLTNHPRKEQIRRREVKEFVSAWIEAQTMERRLWKVRVCNNLGMQSHTYCVTN